LFEEVAEALDIETDLEDGDILHKVLEKLQRRQQQ